MSIYLLQLIQVMMNKIPIFPAMTPSSSNVPFFLSIDRTVSTAVKQAEWSPTRDLLACLTQDCQVHAYRLTNFQCIWALSFESEATTLCWQPDGEHIAVGHADGSVSIISTENGETKLQVWKIPCSEALACQFFLAYSVYAIAIVWNVTSVSHLALTGRLQ